MKSTTAQGKTIKEHYMHEVWKEDIEDVNCRLCKTDRETVGHILCGCQVLLKSEYFMRHDGMM